jgi:glycosyltransferase involved in cell wall biosynthesis
MVHDTNTYGGLELHVLMLCKYIDPARYEVAVAVPGYSDPNRSSPPRLIEEVLKAGIPLLRPEDPGDSRFLSTFKETYNKSRLFVKNEIDVVHIHTCLPNGAQKDTIAAKLAGVKAIIRSEHLPPSKHYRPEMRYTLKPFDLMTDYIVSGSDSCQEEQEKLLKRNPNKLFRTFYGIELSRFNPNHNIAEAKQRLGLDPGIPVVGNIARLAPEKGQKYFIGAVPHVLEKFGPVNFLIVGDGPLREELHEQVKNLGIEQYVHFAGFQPDTIPYMAAMDLAAMSSLNEGISLAMLEYMAMGKPVVSSAEPSFKETVRDGESGIVVALEDSVEMANGIVRVLRDRGLADRIARNGLQRVTNEFSIKRQVEELMDLYDRALGVNSTTTKNSLVA